MSILTEKTNLVAASSTWQQYMKSAIRKPEILLKHLDLPADAICDHQATGPFPLFAPLPFVSRIEHANREDPLLLQLLPTPDENNVVQGFKNDPLNEQEFSLSPGLLKKYDRRVLLIVNGTCAIHCRYCFRRNFPYDSTPKSFDGWQEWVAQIGQDNSIEEVILSGGDPLTVVDASLGPLLDALNSIPHLKRVRFHTRLPIVIPQRVTAELASLIGSLRLKPIIVVHVNHANELDEAVSVAIKKLVRAGALVLNQSVLLKNVNDSVETLIDLSKRLVDIHVTPYYLHQLDPVSGTAHFKVPIEKGIELITQMRAKTSGYLVPRYAQEIPGKLNKTILA